MLTRIAERYLSGATEFYARIPGNPWQAAHDDFELALGKHWDQPDEIARHAKVFENCIMDLLERYRPFAAGQKGSGASLGFYSNSQEEADVRTGNMHRVCAACGAKEGFRIARHPSMGQGLFCRGCVAA